MVAMGRRFVRETSYRDLVVENPAALAAIGTQLVTGAESAILVSARGGGITGMIGLAIFAQPFSGVRTAGEIFWWVDPAARGDGVRLFRAAERWATDHAADQFQASAPTGQLEAVYARWGFRPVERLYQRALPPVLFAPLDTPQYPTTPPLEQIQVVDDVLADPIAYRQACLTGRFEDVPDGGVVWHGISRTVPTDELRTVIERGFPGLRVDLLFCRQSPAGQIEPHVVHSDLSMGAWSAILYLTPQPATGDGTAFWQRRSDGARETPAGTIDDYVADGASWADLSAWTPWYVVPARFNRLVVFPSRLYHSRARENYGAGEHARLIQVAFGGFV